MRDDLRRRILDRRAAFIAAAIAGSAANCGPCNPMACLEPPMIEGPQPVDAGSDSTAVADANAD